MKWVRKNNYKKINWWMVISHHPPIQYDRTFCLFKIRFCTRCTGIFIGILLPFIANFLNLWTPESLIVYIICLLFPIPAILNFILNELGKIKNCQSKRIITGTLLGYSIGKGIFMNLWEGNISDGFIILSWIIMLEILTALILYRSGKLNDFFKQYEDGLYKNDHK